MEKLLELLVLDTPDESGVIYPASVIMDAVYDFETRIRDSGEEEGVFGEKTPPQYAKGRGIPNDFTVIDIASISHIVKHMWVEKKKLICKIKLLNEFAEMEKEDKPIFGAVRATGIIDERNICTTYSIITVDLVIPEE